MENEIWRDVVGYERLYQVSNTGLVKSLSRNVPCRIGFRVSIGRLIKQIKMPNGYLRLSLCKEGKVKNHYVHRLAAEAFIENLENKRCVNHINEVKHDNNVTNLEWMTHEENLRYSRELRKDELMEREEV